MNALIDMNLSPLWVRLFVERGIEAAHWSTVGPPTAPDSQILDYAASNGFVVFTHDLDFGMLLAARKSRGPSVLQVRTQDVLPTAIGTIVLRAIASASEHLEAGAIVTVDVAQHRIRLLPI
jgi:predicted nuclease of predicted toxin-antitoxin system